MKNEAQFYDIAAQIDNILVSGFSQATRELLRIIEKHSSYEDYFLKNVKSVDWFYLMKEKGYYSPQKTPAPMRVEQGYKIPEWNVLPYLERVSEQVNVPGNEKYIDELLAIIKDVSDYASSQHIDNYRTWWYLVKILVNIPNEKIPLEIIDLIPIWLGSKFDTTLQGSDIATNLLPKFLPDVPTEGDVQKAEKIVKYITKIKWSKLPERLKGGIFRKEEEPKTIVDTHWLIKSFITQKNAIKVGKKCSERPIYLLADRLKEIFRRQYPTHDVEVELDDKTYRITVSHKKDYEFDCSVGIIREEQLKADKPGEKLRKSLSAKPEELFKFEIRECKNMEGFIEKIKVEISKSDIPKEIEQKFEEKIGTYFYNSIFSDYSYIWFKSISTGSGLLVPETEETLTLILRNILLAKAKKDKSATQNIFKEFLGDKYQYLLFKRLVLFVIGECWDEFKEEFWKIVDAQSGEQLFHDLDYEAELYTLLEKNIGRFTPKEKERLKEIIEKGPQRRYLPEENQDRYVSYWKQKWYSALKADPDFASLYDFQRSITQVEEEIRFKEPEVRLGLDPSPLTKEDLLRMPNRELAEFLLTFKTKDLWQGPTVRGLSDTLKEAVQEQPEKFINELSPFLNSAYLYIYDILWGARDAWNNKKSIEWGKLFDFIKQYINRDEFWQDKFKMDDDHWNADHRWVVRMIGELIQDGTRDDNRAFAENHLPAAQEIIFLIIDNLKIEEEKEIIDPVTHALNTAFGKTIDALIELALRIARLEDKKGEKKEVKWSDDLKNKYEKLLKDGVIEAYTLLGQYMPNLYYLDKSWVEQKINEFESIEKELWSSFMYGYLLGGKVYDSLYKLMRKHYLKAMSYPFKEKHAEERLVQHIAISYLRGIEDISENSLFGRLINKWNPSHIRELIGFFWMQRNYLVVKSDENEKLRNKIIEFWKWLYERYKDKESLNEDDKKILSKATKLTLFLKQIDAETFKWLKLSAHYANIDFDSPFFIEYLDELKDKGDKLASGKYVEAIFLEMFDAFTPDYDQKHIRSIVEYLYEVRDKETIDSANKLCNIYGSRGLEFLRDIYEKNNLLKP